MVVLSNMRTRMNILMCTAALLVLANCVYGIRGCSHKREYYPVPDSGKCRLGYFLKTQCCRPCEKCDTGYTYKDDSCDCIPCPLGTFSNDQVGTKKCITARNCELEFKVTLKYATNTSNADCGGCWPGFEYYQNNPNYGCEKKPDLHINLESTPPLLTRTTHFGITSTTYKPGDEKSIQVAASKETSPDQSILYVIVVGLAVGLAILFILVVVVVVVLIGCSLYKKRKAKRLKALTEDRRNNSSSDGGADIAAQHGTRSETASVHMETEGPSTIGPSVKAVPFQTDRLPSSQLTDNNVQGILSYASRNDGSSISQPVIYNPPSGNLQDVHPDREGIMSYRSGLASNSSQTEQWFQLQECIEMNNLSLSEKNNGDHKYIGSTTNVGNQTIPKIVIGGHDEDETILKQPLLDNNMDIEREQEHTRSNMHYSEPFRNQDNFKPAKCEDKKVFQNQEYGESEIDENQDISNITGSHTEICQNDDVESANDDNCISEADGNFNNNLCEDCKMKTQSCYNCRQKKAKSDRRKRKSTRRSLSESFSRDEGGAKGLS